MADILNHRNRLDFRMYILNGLRNVLCEYQLSSSIYLIYIDGTKNVLHLHSQTSEM